MPKTLLLCARATLLLLPAAACAQGSLTISGTVDTNVIHGSGSLASRTQVGSGGLGSAGFAFSGQEDLGGGHKAVFWLESAVFTDDGRGMPTNVNNQAPGAPPLAGGQGFTINRLLYVGIYGPWGRLRTGRDYTPNFAVHALYDPTAVGGLMGSQASYGSLTVGGNPTGVRASNSIAFATHEGEGWLVHASYAIGENDSASGATVRDGHYRGVRVVYLKPPIDVAVAVGLYKLAAVGDMKEIVFGGKFEIGKLQVWTHHVRDTTGSANRMHGSMLAVTRPVGQFLLRASWSNSVLQDFAGAHIGTAAKLAVGGSYNLSKRTALYATVAHVRNSHGASALPMGGIAVTAPNRGASGQEFGVRHNF